MALVSHSLKDSKKTNFEFSNFFLQCCNKYFEESDFGEPNGIYEENLECQKAAGQRADRRLLSLGREKLYQDAFLRLISKSPE